jgi:hypothetical protein
MRRARRRGGCGKPPSRACGRDLGPGPAENRTAGAEPIAARLVSDEDLAGIWVTNPDRVMFGMLPELLQRPFSLVRCPIGEQASCFFQRYASPGMPSLFICCIISLLCMRRRVSGQAAADRTSVAGPFCIFLAANSLIFGMYRRAVTGDDH